VQRRALKHYRRGRLLSVDNVSARQKDVMGNHFREVFMKDGSEDDFDRKLRDVLSAGSATTDIEREIVTALQADGVDTIEGLVQKLAVFYARRESVAMSNILAVSKPGTWPQKATKIGYRVPSIPLCMDGEWIEAEAISKFNNRNVNFVLFTIRATKPVLYGFTGNEILIALKTQYFNSYPAGLGFGGDAGGGISYDPGGAGSSGGGVCDPPFYYDLIQMFDNPQWRGNWFWLSKGYHWPDLRHVDRAADRNSVGRTDCISSVMYY
jgi:hypothetical protein